jgi:uncharacterized protein (TIGR02145 family)
MPDNTIIINKLNMLINTIGQKIVIRISVTLFFIGFYTVAISAQVIQKMSFQAVIRNNANVLIISSPVGMKISIIKGSASGAPVYVETHTPVTNTNGMISIEIGGGTVSNGTFEGIDWSTGPYFIKTETAIAAPLTEYTLSETRQLLSVPYAFYSINSETYSQTEGLRQQIKVLEDNMITAGTFKLVDIEGNKYKVVKIGSQVWMAENLKTITYNDGTSIPLVTGMAAWAALTTPAYSWLSNNELAYKDTYGALYNWYTVNTNKLCPAGWHVPSDTEWTTLSDYLINNGFGYGGSGNDIGKSMAAKSGWDISETPGTIGNDPGTNNSSGFTGLAGGQRAYDGSFLLPGFLGYWWSATWSYLTVSWGWSLYYSKSVVDRTNEWEPTGLSVRCIRD